MPTTYTHFAFGSDVFELLDKNLRHELRPYLDYYNAGVHGPDILFYYHAFRKNDVNRYGAKIHHEQADVFFRHAFSVYLEQEEKDKICARAYLAGFMTHYILDSSCHPYINKRIRETGISHTEIETDLDSLIMRRAGLRPRSFHPGRHLKATWKIARLIAPYFDMSAGKIWLSLLDMKLVVNHVFVSSLGIKRHFFSFLKRRVRPSLNMPNHYVKPRINAGNRVTCQHLLSLYAGCMEECAGMIEKMIKALDQNDESFCEDERLKRLFS